MEKDNTNIELINDCDESILDDNGQYDMKRFSMNEYETIINVINTVKTYPENIRSICFANEVYPILYKPRYVLTEMIIQIYKDSENYIDKFSCAISYEMQGASKRKLALSKFEKCINYIEPEFMNKFIYFSPLNVYMKFSRLYESEHEYDKAIYYTEIGSKYGEPDNSYFKKRIDELKAKKAKNTKKRTRKKSQSDIEFEEKVKNAALFFINNFWN